MKILNLAVLRGPNYWSNFRQKLIVMKLDLGIYEELPTNKLAGFNDKLKSLIPSLYGHYCSYTTEGGFFARLEEGTWLGHVTEHVALELQTLAGMDCGFGRTFSAHEHGVYQVIFCYQIEEAGLLAAEIAVNIVSSLAQGHYYNTLEQDLLKLRKIFQQERLGPSTAALLKEAEKRNIPFFRFKDKSLITFGHGRYQKKIWATVTSQTNAIALDVAANKSITKNILAASYIPVPAGMTIHTLSELEEAITQLRFPLVIKPQNGNHGRGIITNIQHKEKAILAFNMAKNISDAVIVEKFIEGDDYRFLVINHRVEAVAKRTPAMIVGDGKASISELINRINADPKRGIGHENILTTIKIDEETHSILHESALTLESVLEKGTILYLKTTANLSTGGIAKDVTLQVHPDNIELAQRVSRLISLDVCGIDIISSDIQLPLTEKTGAVIEVNAGPGLRMHLSPNEGESRNVAAPIINMLYPANAPSRVPIVAVTGTNGKTTVVRLIAQLAKQANHYVGFTTTEGIYLNHKLVHSGDCSGPLSAEVVLQEPLVDFAVLECARGGILRSGLGFDQCDISIITNITEDHLDLNDIHTLEELTRLKGVVARSTTKKGYAILNCEDDRVYNIKNELQCNVALFGLEKSSRITRHCDNGGLCAYIENSHIVVQKGENKQIITSIKDLPLTFNGAAVFMVKNILPAVLAGIISHFSIEQIQDALCQFYPSVENIPGRMNVFNFNDFEVLLDYAHNDGAYIELKDFFGKTNYDKKVGIIAATGNRREKDIQKLGFLAGQIFDEIIIRHNKDKRGRTNNEMTRLLKEGINQSSYSADVKVISNEFEAIKYSMQNAVPNSIIFCSVDDVFDSVEFMLHEKNNFNEQTLINETIS